MVQHFADDNTELREKLASIKNPEHKLIFSLLLNNENVLRSDLALVKLSNYNEGDLYYKDGIIHLLQKHIIILKFLFLTMTSYL
jgi:hypothetical protein